MIIEKSTTVAVRCLDCGPFTIEKVNIFQISGNRDYEIKCECEQKKASIRKKGPRNVEIDYYCPVCDSEHRQLISASRFWSNNAENPLICKATGLNLGYYGDYQLIKKREMEEKEEMESLVAELGPEEFTNPEIILEVLDYLHDLAARDSLQCECHSLDINISLFQDNMKLQCKNCGNFIIVPTTSREDLEDFKKLTKLTLSENSFLLREIISQTRDSRFNS
ncbi:MAG: hypothetical protein ACOC1S_02025 [bacterium]